MSSTSLSDSPGTFKVGCNVAGDFLENRPKFRLFLYRHDNLLNQRTARVGFYSILCAWVKDHKVLSKRSKDRAQNGRQNPAAGHCVGLWFDAILIYAHMISMNIINLTTQS